MSIDAKAKVITAKIETTYGTDATPAAATDAILTRNFRANPLQVDTLDRNLDLPTVGGSKQAITNARQSMSFEVEMAGGGAAATEPKWMRLLQACGIAAGSVEATPDRVEQAPGTAPWDSISLHHFYESQRRKALGAIGTFGATLEAGAYPFWNFEFTGLLPAATPFDESAPGTPDFSAFQEPVEVNTDNTTFTLDSYAAVLRRMEFAMGVGVNLRNLVGSRYVKRGNHTITGSLVIEAPKVSGKNYFTTLQEGSEVALSIAHGTVAGNIVEIAMNQLQLNGIDESEEDDVLMYTLGFRANVSTGSDDILITTK